MNTYSDNPNNDRNARLAAARLKYARRLRQQAANVSDLGTGLPDSAVDLQELAHQLNGTAGSYGFSDVSAYAAALETSLKTDARSAEVPLLAQQLAAAMGAATVTERG